METFVRYFLILSFLKPYPRRTSTTQIAALLKEQGVEDRGLRTIQRDLEKLSGHFPIFGDNYRPRGWCWAKDAAVLLPGMDLHTALSFRLMQEFLLPLIPTACLSAAERHFAEAKRVLRSDTLGQHRSWLDKVQIVSRGQGLLPAPVKEEVLDTVYEALFAERRFSATYRRRSGACLPDCAVNPLGLVFVDKTAYLVCTLWNYDDIKHMPLHRFEKAAVLDLPARHIDGFSLEGYVQQQKEFDYPESEKSLKVVATFSRHAAHHLRETPLAEDQQIADLSDDEVRVSATVRDTSQLRWWLLGFGDQVEVLEPKGLREEMAQCARGMAKRYRRTA